jgi:hypothetical protein
MKRLLLLLLFPLALCAQTITTEPTSQSVQVGQTATFSVEFTGGPCRSLWLINGAGHYGAYADSPISYSIPNVTTAMNGETVQVNLYGCADAGDSYSSTVTLTVAAAPTLSSIAITPASATIGVGQSQTFSALGTFSDGSTQDLSSTATWTTTAGATLNGDTATGTAVGTTTITATVGSISAAATLTVEPVLNITFTPTNEDGSVPSTQLAIYQIVVNSDGSTTYTGVLQLASGTGVLPYNSTLMYEAAFFLNGDAVGQPIYFSPTLMLTLMPNLSEMTYAATLCVTTCTAGAIKSMTFGAQ